MPSRPRLPTNARKSGASPPGVRVRASPVASRTSNERMEFAEEADLPRVLAVDVHGRAAAHRNVLRGGHDGRPPTVRSSKLDDVPQGRAWLDAQDAPLGFPGEYPPHGSDVEDDGIRVQCSIRVAVAGAVRNQGKPLRACYLEGIEDAGDVVRTVYEARRAHGLAPSGKLGRGRRGERHGDIIWDAHKAQITRRR